VAREHDWAVLVGRIAQVMAAGLGRPLTQILEGPEARELASFMQ